jgi:hypothetical protein
MNQIHRIMKFTIKYCSYFLCMALASVVFANADNTLNEKSLKKLLSYSMAIGIMNSYIQDDYDSVACKTAARIVLIQNEIIKNADPQSLDTAQNMIQIANATNKQCSSKKTDMSLKNYTHRA